MIWNGDINPEHIGDRTQKTFSLTQRLVEQQAKREAGLDGDRRVGWLAAALSGRWRMPCRHRLLGEPHRQASSSDLRGIVFRPVRHPVSGLGNLWRRPSVSLSGIVFATSRVGRPAQPTVGAPARHPSGIDRGANGPPLGNVSGPYNLRSTQAPTRRDTTNGWWGAGSGRRRPANGTRGRRTGIRLGSVHPDAWPGPRS
jgi:hypothetical protein